MKERPILFSGPMVRAILEGRKTQTRRKLKYQPAYPETHPWDEHQIASKLRHCPYGKAGDRLWVRETWNGTQGEGLAYRATEPHMDGEPWRPSIFMPRWASRITLEITDVRVQRLQDISEDDAKAEGAPREILDDRGRVVRSIDCPEDEEFATHRAGFQGIWWTIHGGESWALNPWVWVISFRKLGCAQ